MRNKTSSIISAALALLLLLQLFFTACNPARNVPKGQFLLDRVDLKIDQPAIDKEEISSIIKQKPNKRILLIGRFHLGAYNISTMGKKRKWKNWLGNTVGEPPVILDSALNERSEQQIKLYLQKKGYFHAAVKSNITYRKERRARVGFDIHCNKPYRIRNIDYEITDSAIDSLIRNAPGKLIEKGKIFDESILAAEQLRIQRYLQDKGYYRFQKEHIYFDVDSALGGYSLDIDLVVTDEGFHTKPFGDSVVFRPHRRFNIHNVFILPDYNIFKKDRVFPDTATLGWGLYMAYDKELRYKPGLFKRSIFFQQGDFYSRTAVEDTYKRLSSFRNFKAVTLDFTTYAEDSSRALLDAFIKITPAKKQSYSLSAEGTHSSGNFGVSGSWIYQNKNVFKGAEIFEVKLRGALEVQQLAVDIANENISDFVPIQTFNTVEIGPEFSLTYPSALVPFLSGRFGKSSLPRTTLMTAVNFQRRPDYERTIVNGSLAYSWRQGKRIQHTYNPLDLNYVFVTLQPQFESTLDRINDVLIRQSYRPLLIPSFLKYFFTYSDQEEKRRTKYFFRTQFQTSGLIFNTFNEISGTKLSFNSKDTLADPSKSYLLFGIRYSQFWLAELDFRIYHRVISENTLAGRFNFGIGVPYGNSSVLPFVKSFFGGGANDLRAWTARTLGPGSFPKAKEQSYEQIGDIKLQTSLEYRFKVYKMFKAATFIDAGNIWMLRPDSVTQRPGGQFRFDKFYKDIALGTGLGFRVDFSFFIIRLDLGIPLYDPGYEEGNRWVIFVPGRRPVRLNLGIGYPF
jgi:outer membrane translocation and assembly module TamA